MSNKPEKIGTEKYVGRFGAIMSMVGMAVGLGNVWRFPYMVGQYGGGAFVIAYLVCLVIVVIPLAIMEAGYGKGIGKGLMEAYEAALKIKWLSKAIGGLCAIVYGTMNFFFIAVIAISLYFIYICARGLWDTVPAEELYDVAMNNQVMMVLLAVVLTLVIGIVVYKGVGSGIEKVSKVMVPLMFLFFIITVIFGAVAIDGIGKGYDFYLNPDFSVLLKPGVWVAAMGQALFSIGVGPGCVLIYGSHLKKKDDVTVNITTVCLMDTSIAVLAAMAMIPACIALGFDPESGARLIFVVLPGLFEVLPFGNLIGILVFSAIFFAGITSAIAQLEIPVVTFMNGLNWSRKKTTILFTSVTMVAACISVYSDKFLTFWSDFSGNYGFIVTAGIGAIVYGWVYGVNNIRKEFINPSSDIQLGNWYGIWTKFIAIPIMIIIMINSLFPFLG